MTGETDGPLSAAEKTTATRRPCFVLADCSMAAPLPPERRGRQELPDESAAPAAESCRQMVTGDEL